MPERAAIEMELAEEVLRSYGKLRIMARGSSMIPTIFPGDVLFVERNPLARLQPGHIALASRGGRFFAHRIVRLTALGGAPRVITRGDALAADDPAFFCDEILGRVTFVVRGERHIELGDQPGPKASRILRWAIRNSDAVAAGVMWLHSLCGRISAPAGEARTKTLAKLAECL
ncbi:MAG: S24/S26 family peptidase [Candidatus Acidiferrales bacterium]